MPDNICKFVTEIINKEFNISIINKIEILGHKSIESDIVDFINMAKMRVLLN